MLIAFTSRYHFDANRARTNHYDMVKVQPVIISLAQLQLSDLCIRSSMAIFVMYHTSPYSFWNAFRRGSENAGA